MVTPIIDDDERWELSRIGNRASAPNRVFYYDAGYAEKTDTVVHMSSVAISLIYFLARICEVEVDCHFIKVAGKNVLQYFVVVIKFVPEATVA